MTKVLKVIAICAIVITWSCETRAATFFNSLVLGVQNTFEDQNRETFYDLDNDGRASVGDALVGYLRIDGRAIPVGQTFPPDDVYAAFSQRITSITDPATGNNYVYNTGTAATVMSEPIVKGSGTTADLAGLSLQDLTGNASIGGSDMIALFQDVGTDLINNPPPGFGPTSTILDFINEIANSPTSDLDATAFMNDPEDFLQNEFDSAAAVVLDTLALLNSATLAGGLPGQNGFFGGFDVNFNAMAGTIDFADMVDLFVPDPFNPTTHELTVVNAELSGAADLVFPDGAGGNNPYFFGGTYGPNDDPFTAYGLSSNADFNVKPVPVIQEPEPSAIAIWSLMIGICGVFGKSWFAKKRLPNLA